MADIDGYLKQIRSAEAGETVRDAIINCLRDINRDVPVQEEDWEGYMPESTDLTLSGHYKSVHVMHNPSSGKNTKLTTLHATENDTYEPEENEYYNKVVVEVEQSPYTIREEAVEITENGDYYAKGDWGVNGVAEIHVNVQAATSGGPFVVDFYDKPASDPTAAIIETQLVPNGGSAQAVKTPPTSDVGVFTGWNPSPNYVTRDMKCYPVFGRIIVDPTEIQDTWDVIISKKGVGYPLGSHAVLAYGATFTAEEIKTWYPDYTGGDQPLNFYMMMYKVGEGEGNSHSTWLSSAIDINGWINHVIDWTAYTSWPDGHLRSFLNLGLFSHMSSLFKNNIVPVTKYSIISDGTMRPSQDSVWIPGTSEIGTYQTKPTENPNYDFVGSTSWGGNYVTNIGRLDSLSTKYVRDYLNNDRNFVYKFLHNHLDQQYGTFVPLRLRDIASNGYFFYREDTNNTIPLIYGNSWTCNYINIGFCM